MKTLPLTALIAAISFVANASPISAEGLIHQLPADGSWVRFDATGEGLDSVGKATVSVKGTITLKSVGRETRDSTDCRWIELETVLEYQRGDQNGKQDETLKLLIPEKYLTAGQNPRAHVLQAWKKDAQGAIRELDLKGIGAKEVESLDEIFHESPPKVEKQEGMEIKAPGGTFRCTQIDARISKETDLKQIDTRTWLTTEVPFGVAAYRHIVSRSRGGASLGSKSIDLKVSEFGADAKSAIGK